MISEIYFAALAVNGIALLLPGTLIFTKCARTDRLFLGILILLMLPMNAAAYHLVRMPLDGILSEHIHSEQITYWIHTLYAPITEECAKLWFLLIPHFRKRAEQVPIYLTALAVGVGFGAGEAWNVASLIADSPVLAGYHWYQLGGFIGERSMVCVLHAGFSGAALFWILKHKNPAGILAGMVLHFLCNYPIFLSAENRFGLGNENWQIILQLWTLLFLFLMIALLYFTEQGKALFSRDNSCTVTCSKCGKPFKKPFITISFLDLSFVRCPNCRKQSWLKQGEKHVST